MGSIAWPGVWGPDGSLRLRFWSSRVRPSARNVTTSLTDPVLAAVKSVSIAQKTWASAIQGD